MFQANMITRTEYYNKINEIREQFGLGPRDWTEFCSIHRSEFYGFVPMDQIVW